MTRAARESVEPLRHDIDSGRTADKFEPPILHRSRLTSTRRPPERRLSRSARPRRRCRAAKLGACSGHRLVLQQDGEPIMPVYDTIDPYAVADVFRDRIVSIEQIGPPTS